MQYKWTIKCRHVVSIQFNMTITRDENSLFCFAGEIERKSLYESVCVLQKKIYSVEIEERNGVISTISTKARPAFVVSYCRKAGASLHRSIIGGGLFCRRQRLACIAGFVARGSCFGNSRNPVSAAFRDGFHPRSATVMASLEDSWKKATEGLDAAVCDSWFTRLQELYSEEKRTYHNLDSLREKLNHYYEIKNHLKNPRAVLLAIFFQNFEYDPKALVFSEDKNLEHFNAFADEAEIPSDAELREETCALLKVAATHSTEAHKVGGAFGSEDAHYFLDLDMAILGSPPDSYAEYRERIRGEYSFLSEPMYTALRLKVLQNFLQIPNIFATVEFRDKLEEQARQNIQAEVEMLS